MTHKLVMSFLIVLMALALAERVDAQGQRPSPAHLEAMKKLGFLVGEWKGEGWNEMVPGQRRTSPISETVQSKLGGTVLLVEGLGKVKVPGKDEDVVVHNALGVLTYDESAKLYRMRSFLADGHFVDSEAVFTDGGFQWAFKTHSIGIRYTVRLTEKGEWFEIGEMSQDGKSWRKFHEMTLQRVK